MAQCSSNFACFQVDKTNDRTVVPLSSELQQRLCSVPPLASRDVREMLISLRERQELLVGQVLDQQNELQRQVTEIQSLSKTSVDVQNSILRRQDDFFNEMRRLSTALKTSRPFRSEGIHRSSRRDDATAQLPPIKPEEQLDLNERSGEDSSHSAAQDEADETTKPPEAQPAGMALNQDLGRRGSVDSTKSLDSAISFSKLYSNSSDTGGWRTRFKALTMSKEFEIGIAIAVMMNCFILCWEAQYQGLDVGFSLQYPGRSLRADAVWPGAYGVFVVCEWFFGCMFLFELLAKLMCYRCRYFYIPRRSSKHHALSQGRCCSPTRWKLLCWHKMSSVQGWNVLDFLCVAAFLFDKLAVISSINPQMLRMLRLFRLFRLVRLLRVLESLDHLYVMTTAISGLKQVLVWAILLLTVMLLACDLFLVKILHATYFDQVEAKDLSDDQLEKHHKMYEYFGTCTRCMLSMFEITLGNWPPVARLLSEEVSEWFTIICLLHKLTIGFAVVGVFSGVIMQETFKVAQTDDIILLRQKKATAAVLKKKLKALFEELDESNDGCLEADEFAAIADLPEIKTWLGIETDDLQTLFSLIDIDGDGNITLDELLARLPRIQGPARSIDMLAHGLQLRRLQERLASKDHELRDLRELDDISWGTRTPSKTSKTSRTTVSRNNSKNKARWTDMLGGR